MNKKEIRSLLPLKPIQTINIADILKKNIQTVVDVFNSNDSINDSAYDGYFSTEKSGLYLKYIPYLKEFKRRGKGRDTYIFSFNSSDIDLDEATKVINDFLETALFSTIISLIAQHFDITNKNIPSFKRSSHFVDQLLKPKPLTEYVQKYLFEDLNEENKNKILTEGYTAEWINQKGEGIKPTSGEFKLFIALSILLHDKSNTKDKDSPLYYSGNVLPEDIDSSIDWTPTEVKPKSPALTVSIYEIAREYVSYRKVSGRDIEIVHNLLKDLAFNKDKFFLIRYKRKKTTPQGYSDYNFSASAL